MPMNVRVMHPSCLAAVEENEVGTTVAAGRSAEIGVSSSQLSNTAPKAGQSAVVDYCACRAAPERLFALRSLTPDPVACRVARSLRKE